MTPKNIPREEDPLSMDTLHGFVINLERRPDRLTALQENLSGTDGLTLSICKAIDGRTLYLDDDLLRRIDPWNFSHLSQVKLRSVVACALSHVACWKLIKSSGHQWHLVLEDDARLINPSFSARLVTLPSLIPPDAEIVWLNEYEAPPIGNRLYRGLKHLGLRSRRFRHGALEKLSNELGADLIPVKFKRWRPLREKSTEAYLITPRFATKLTEAIENHLGAIDEHMRGTIARLDSTAYELSYPLFRQADTTDTDIQINE